MKLTSVQMALPIMLVIFCPFVPLLPLNKTERNLHPCIFPLNPPLRIFLKLLPRLLPYAPQSSSPKFFWLVSPSGVFPKLLLQALSICVSPKLCP